MSYQYVAASVAGFVQQLAEGYVPQGYVFYIYAHGPARKAPAATDAEMIEHFGLEGVTETPSNSRGGGVRYLRFQRHFAALNTHPFPDARDIRVKPFLFLGYSIGGKQDQDGSIFNPSVRIGEAAYQELTVRFEGLALHPDVDALAGAIRAIPFERYAGVREQIDGIVRIINCRRHLAGLERVPPHFIHRERQPFNPFEPNSRGSPGPDRPGSSLPSHGNTGQECTSRYSKAWSE